MKFTLQWCKKMVQNHKCKITENIEASTCCCSDDDFVYIISHHKPKIQLLYLSDMG